MAFLLSRIGLVRPRSEMIKIKSNQIKMLIDVKKERKDKKAEQAKRYMTPTLRSRLQRPRRSRGGRDHRSRDRRVEATAEVETTKAETTKAEAARSRPPRPHPTNGRKDNGRPTTFSAVFTLADRGPTPPNSGQVTSAWLRPLCTYEARAKGTGKKVWA
jgi:hypothetical protein